MLLCPAILMIVKASTPSRPSRVNMVCRNECTTKSSGNFKSSRTLGSAHIARRPTQGGGSLLAHPLRRGTENPWPVLGCSLSLGIPRGPADPELSRTLRLFRPDQSNSGRRRSKEHTSELQSLRHLVC